MKKFLFFMAVVIVIAIIGSNIEVNDSNANYNGGICLECGGEYKFTSAVHYKNSGDRYYYTCDQCGHTIQTVRIYK